VVIVAIVNMTSTTTGMYATGKASIPVDLRHALINGSAQPGVLLASNNSNVIFNNTTNMTDVMVQPPTYDPVMIFILVIIAIAILVIIFNGFNREERY
jgi:hypothetical protein